MPRIGLPRSKATGEVPQGRSSSSSLSPSAMLRIAVAAIVFRGIAALVAMFVGHAFPNAPATAAAESSGASFGIYPWLTYELTRLAGGVIRSPATPALVVSWLAFAGAMVMLRRIAQLDMDDERAEGAALLAAVFPFASTFGQATADALFLLLALAAFNGFRQGQWITGGISGALATVTLPAGILMLPALAWTGWRRERRASIGLLVSLAVTACGLLGYFSYLYYRNGPTGGWAAAMDQWGFFQFAQAPWTAFQRLHTSHPSPVESLSGVLAVIFLVAVPVVWWRFDGGYALYMLAMLWMAVTSGRHAELGRACALMFPVFMLVAGVRWRVVLVAAVTASAMFYALVQAL